MKRRIILISIISALIICIVLGIIFLINKPTKDNINTENNNIDNEKSQIVSNDVETEKKEIKEESTSTDENEENAKEKIEEDLEESEQIPPVTKATSNNNSKVQTQSSQTSTDIDDTSTAVTEQNTPSTPIVESTPITEDNPVEVTKDEPKPVETPTRCTNNNNHGMDVGNTGKWYSTKDEAIAYYNSQLSYWGNLWETDQIDDATYYSKCPSGYEVWSCMYCGKWTINFYYR